MGNMGQQRKLNIIKIFNEEDIIGFEYTSEYPWDFQKEFSNFIDNIYMKYKNINNCQ